MAERFDNYNGQKQAANHPNQNAAGTFGIRKTGQNSSDQRCKPNRQNICSHISQITPPLS